MGDTNTDYDYDYDDYDNGAFFSGKITKSILRKRKVVKMKRKKFVKIKKNKMLVQKNKSKSVKHGKKLFGGSVTKVKQRQVRNIPSYSTRSLNNTSNTNNNYRTTSRLSLSKVLSTARQLTPEQQARTANCINYVFNILGGPRGPVGPTGKDGTAGGATAECNGYYINQNLRTTDGVTFNTVEATTSYSLAGVTVTSTEWGYLANMDQDVNTTADVTFNSVTATTSYTLGSTKIDATQWNRLASIDQDLSTTSDVTFNSVTATTSYTLGSTTIDATQWNRLATIDQDLSTTSDVTFNTVTATTSYSLGSTTIDATQWNRLASIDQDLSTTSDVTFNSVTATTSYSLGNTTIDATQWNRLASIDQDLSTTDNVTFNSVTATTSYTLGSTIIDATTWNHLASINQDLSTTDNVTFNSVTATTSYSLGSTTINATTWNHLASIDQDLATTDDVNFNSVTIAAGQNLTLNSGQVYINSPSTTAIDFYTANINRMTISDDSFFPNISPYNLGRTISRFQTLYLGTSIDLGGTAIDATQWNRLATIDQDLATTDDVNFNSVTVANGERVNLLSTGEVYITSPSTTAMEFYTQNTLRATLSNTSYSPGGDNTQDLGASTRQWKTLYLGSTADLAGTPIGTTQWNYLAGVTAPFSDQSLNIADNVNFNSIEVPYNTTDETPTVRLGSANVGVYSTDNNDIRFTLGGNLKYIIDLTGFYPEDTNNVDLGNSSNSRYWKDFYLAQKANVGQLNISNPTVPGTTAAAGTAGDIAWDANYIYVCIATNSWKRALLSTW